MKRAVAALGVLISVGLALGQSATISVTADGAASAVVSPGSSVEIEAVVSWTGGAGWVPAQGQLSGLKGDIKVQDDVGTGTGLWTQLPLGPQWAMGPFVGGSLVLVGGAFTPAYFTGGFVVPPSGNNTGIVMGRYTLDLTGVAPGTYSVDWQPDSAEPDVRLYPVTSSPNSVGVPTTLVGARITVTPGPGAGMVLVVWWAAVRRRRGGHALAR